MTAFRCTECNGAHATYRHVEHVGTLPESGPPVFGRDRLPASASTAQANTWSTFTTAHVNRDGSGYVEVSRNGKTLHRFDFGPERES